MFSRFGYTLSGVPFTNAHAPQNTDIQSLAGILQCVSVFRSGVTFSGAPLPTLVRPKHKYSVDGWYPAHVCFKFGCYLSGAPLATPIASQAQRFSGWLVSYSARFSLLQFGCYLFWSPFLCSLRSLAPVISAPRFNDSGPTD